MKRGGVVPTRTARLLLGAFLLKKDTQRSGSRTKGCGYPRGQAVSGRSTYDQHPLGAVFDRSLRLDVVDLVFDIGFTASGMGGNTKKTAYARLDDHELKIPGLFSSLPARTGSTEV